MRVSVRELNGKKTKERKKNAGDGEERAAAGTVMNFLFRKHLATFFLFLFIP